MMPAIGALQIGDRVRLRDGCDPKVVEIVSVEPLMARNSLGCYLLPRRLIVEVLPRVTR